MKLGIVGHEAAKFTRVKEEEARSVIRELIRADCDLVVSGACHLGGVDIYAVEEARQMGLPTVEYPPLNYSWSEGYKPRNIQIAEHADKVICLVVKELPPEYQGMRFKLCYHCKTDTHVKSGGCWTARYAGKLGKPFEIVEI